MKCQQNKKEKKVPYPKAKKSSIEKQKTKENRRKIPLNRRKKHALNGDRLQCHSWNSYPLCIKLKANLRREVSANRRKRDSVLTQPDTDNVIRISGERFNRSFDLCEKGFEATFLHDNSNAKVKIVFPINCVFGKRKVNIELYFPLRKVTFRDGYTLVTPVLFVSLERETSFLKRVSIDLPFNQGVKIDKSMVLDSCFRRELTLKQGGCIIQSFKFSPVAVAKSTTDCLRNLNYFDESKLFEKKAVYITMKQSSKKLPASINTYRLEFECRPFKSQKECESFRSNPFWQYYIISDKSAFEDMETNGRVAINISGQTNAITFVDETEPTEGHLVFRIPRRQRDNQRDINCLHYSNKQSLHCELASQTAWIANNWRGKQHIKFSYGDSIRQYFSFPILLKEEGDYILSKEIKPLSITMLSEFLGRLNGNWIKFMTHEMPLGRGDLDELACLDFICALKKMLSGKPDAVVKMYLEKLEEGAPKFAQEDNKLNPKKRLLSISERYFIAKYNKGHDDAKQLTFSLIEEQCPNNVPHDDARQPALSRFEGQGPNEEENQTINSLEEENQTKIAEVMVFCDEIVLKEQMRNAFEKDCEYGLKRKAAKLSDELLTFLGLPKEAIRNGESLSNDEQSFESR